ncbi:histidine phosphatase family protein [Kosakonia sp. S58]|uniref:histidine phosphatase family protein n=1 Tax=unclassified Kosakonia TaxID=2632876 RepID=UPI0019051C9E|nr:MULTISPECIES: histidine phosphatase family protein [unclassified Kosakonia]MBK0081717.1 histidine phosphatase family protein [Kosakonia sp. S57]MBK0088183.1 histidine phosphatase family protein [Kosakonia sp. S58]
MKVILVRHAQTQWNRAGMIQGQQDSPVTERGERETAALLAALKDEGYAAESVFSSPLARARSMGEQLAALFQAPLVIDAALMEQSFGGYEGLSTQKLQAEADALFAHDAAFCPPGGESLAQAVERMLAFLQLQHTRAAHKTLCVVCHGHVTQGLLALLKEGSLENFARYAQPNASYAVLEMAEEKCEVLRWGVATHLRTLDV